MGWGFVLCTVLSCAGLCFEPRFIMITGWSPDVFCGFGGRVFSFIPRSAGHRCHKWFGINRRRHDNLLSNIPFLQIENFFKARKSFFGCGITNTCGTACRMSFRPRKSSLRTGIQKLRWNNTEFVKVEYIITQNIQITSKLCVWRLAKKRHIRKKNWRKSGYIAMTLGQTCSDNSGMKASVYGQVHDISASPESSKTKIFLFLEFEREGAYIWSVSLRTATFMGKAAVQGRKKQSFAFAVRSKSKYFLLLKVEEEVQTFDTFGPKPPLSCQKWRYKFGHELCWKSHVWYRKQLFSLPFFFTNLYTRIIACNCRILVTLYSIRTSSITYHLKFCSSFIMEMFRGKK